MPGRYTWGHGRAQGQVGDACGGLAAPCGPLPRHQSRGRQSRGRRVSSPSLRNDEVHPGRAPATRARSAPRAGGRKTYAAGPIWGILLGLALGLERPTPWGIVGVCLAFLGVAVVVYGGLTGSTSLLGNLLVVVATVCWGSYAVLSLPLLLRYSPLVVASYTMLFGGLGALPLALPGFLDAGWADASGRALVALAYSTLLVAAFGFWSWQRGVSHVGANRVLI